MGVEHKAVRHQGSGPSRYVPRLGRIPIRDLMPQQPGALWPAKAYRGEVVPFSATVFREGHDQLGVQLVLTDPSGAATTHWMRPIAPGTDRWQAEAVVDAEGAWTWQVRAFTDDWATWLHNAEIKIPARADVDLMVTMGRLLLERAGGRRTVKEAAAAFADPVLAAEAKLAIALDPRLTAVIRKNPLASLTT
ncbi:MAG: maltotransferase domain-containing protein, partial [Rhodoglobus sp.]